MNSQGLAQNKETTIVVGLGETAVTNTQGSSVKTYALGSCIAVVMIDSINNVVGLTHVVLPSSTLNKERSISMPGYFADTAVPYLLKKMKDCSPFTNESHIVTKIVGGANVLNTENTIDIGERNIVAVKNALKSLGLSPLKEDVGGFESRTVEVFTDTHEVVLTSSKREITLL